MSEASPFGDVLRRYRLAAGLSQERLAERTGLSVRGLSDLERGARRTPRLETVRRLADALELDQSGRGTLFRAARDAGSPLPSPSEPGHLPVPPTPLIGRERELADLTARIHDPGTRLLTLTGPGGVGKSRLALEVVTVTAAAFPHGAWLVELAPLRDPALVLQAIAHTLGIHPEGGTPLPVSLQRFLRDRRLLLLLDNVEHLLPAATDIAALLAASPHLTVLATSRAPLSIRVEQQHVLHPLAFPVNGETASAQAVGATPAAQLLVARIGQVRPGFTLQDADAPVIATICQRLDGLPLALELVAAHAKTLPPAALLARLERRLPMLNRGPRDLPERHQTLDATIAWSHDLLGPEERQLLRRLSVFAGGWTIDAADVVAGDHAPAYDRLGALVNASLVTPIAASGTEPRFTMLETVREFAAGQLRESGEEAETRAAHAAWVLELVERGGPELVGASQVYWTSRFDEERDNLRAALDWALDCGKSEIAMRLAGASWQYWLTRGHATEGRHWLDRVLTLAGNADPSPALTGTWFAAGTLAAAQDDYDTAEPLLEAALAALKASGETARIARTVHVLGIAALSRNDPAHAAPLLEEAIMGYGEPVDPTFAPWRALAQSQLAGALAALGQHDRASALGERAIELQRELGSDLGVALGRFYLGDVARCRGDGIAARRHFRDSIALLTQLGDRWYVVSAIACWLSVTACELPSRQAARLIGAHAAIRKRVTTPIWPPYAGPLAAAEARVRAKLSKTAFTRAWQQGADLDLDAAIAEVLAIEDEAHAATAAEGSPAR